MRIVRDWGGPNPETDRPGGGIMSARWLCLAAVLAVGCRAFPQKDKDACRPAVEAAGAECRPECSAATGCPRPAPCPPAAPCPPPCPAKAQEELHVHIPRQRVVVPHQAGTAPESAQRGEQQQ